MKPEIIVGLDEVGRGPLAGDVVAGAVILDPNNPIMGLADSKKISEKKRDALAIEIKAKALAWGIGRCTPQEIDDINILQASMLAMQRAFQALNFSGSIDMAYVDGNRCPDLPCKAEAVIKGDSKIAEISAASIIAKVTRDAEMLALHTVIPQYGFARHKGYPTKIHLAALAKHGPTKYHRKSYAPVKKCL
jgi:ribonuclease HII